MVFVWGYFSETARETRTRNATFFISLCTQYLTVYIDNRVSLVWRCKRRNMGIKELCTSMAQTLAVGRDLIKIYQKFDSNKASRIKSHPVIEVTVDVFNFSKRFEINCLNSSNVAKLSQVKCLLISSHNRSIGLTCGVCGGWNNKIIFSGIWRCWLKWKAPLSNWIMCISWG